MLSEHFPRANRGTGSWTGPPRYPIPTSVAPTRMFPAVCLNAFRVQELILWPESSSSFGPRSLLLGAWLPWADICLPGCHPSVLSSLWNLFGGLSFSHVMTVDLLENCGPVFSSSPSPLQILGTTLSCLSYIPPFCSTLSAVTLPSYLGELWCNL